MKLVLAAAVAAFALPAIAQDAPAAPPPAPQTAPMPTPPADPAAPPAAMEAPAAPAPMAAPMPPAPMAAAPTSDGNYPMCSKTVTDHCTERSNGRGERLHSTPRKPG